MTLRYPYQPVALKGPHPSGAAIFWRPFLPVRIIGATGTRYFAQALLDPGSQDTIFPLAAHRRIGASLRPDAGHVLRWRGTTYPLRFGDVELELGDQSTVWTWPAVIGFSDAPPPYVLLGWFGCLEYLDATFHGAQHVVELRTNSDYAGIV